MVNGAERLKHYKSQGLVTEEGFDKPGVIYTRHFHERTVLFTISGELTITLYDNNKSRVVVLKPGDEYVVGERQEHSAVTGKDGWGYIAAWDEEEAKKYEGTH